jgi:filamentous hemagglutinin
LWHRCEGKSAIRCPYKLKTGKAQTGLTNPDQVDFFKQEMLEGRWAFQGQGETLVYWREGNTIYVAEGYHRINAALEIGKQSGDWSYLEKLLQYGRQEPGSPPKSDIGRFPTRSWWSRWLERLGW